MDELRIELRTRNNVLFHAIFDRWKSVNAFCREHHEQPSTIGGYLNLSRSPYVIAWATGDIGESMRLSNTATRIAEKLGLIAEDLFPRELYQAGFPRRLAAEVPVEKFVALQAARQIALPPAQEDAVLQRETHSAIEAALATLKPREQQVMRMRFGLDDGGERTSEEIAAVLRVSHQRVRQIQSRALEKLRHPSRSRSLETLR